MVEAASLEGYAGATVVKVVESAGVSRAGFYEKFDSRDDCFLAAYREKSQGIRVALQAAARENPPDDLLGAVLSVLLREVATDRAAVRLVLIEALAAPAAIRAEHEQLLADLEQLVGRYLDEQDPAGAIQIPATALLVGVSEVIASRVLAGPVDDLARLRDDLLRWVDSYRLPSGLQPWPQRRWQELGRFAKSVPAHPSNPPTLLPRGRTALSPAHAASDRRRRLLEATARLAFADGYAALTVARIASAARVPRAAFYANFECKRDALLAAQTQALQDGMAAAAAAYSPLAPWPERVWQAGAALLSSVAGNRDYAHLDFVESYAAGEAAIRRRHQNHMAFAMFMEDGYRHLPQTRVLPPVCLEAITGGVFGLMRRQVVAGKTERMLSLLPAAAYTILAPFMGPEEAAMQVQARAAGAR